jgi:hypothetical protein
MGLFGKKQDLLADAGYADAIPVATLVPEETEYLRETTTTTTKMITAPVIASVPTTSKQQQQQAFVINDPTLSRGPMLMRQCPHCQRESRTRVTTAPAWQTWVASVRY